MSAIESPALGSRDKEGCFRVIKADRLTSICAALLRAVGASEEEAQAVPTGCVNANLAGHDSHGVRSIPYYIDCIKVGDIVPGAEWSVVQEPPTTAVIANPISIAMPSDLEAPFVLNMPTSALAASKIFLAVARGEKIPKGWIIDGEGWSTTDPRDYRKAASEGYKGSGLAAMIEVLCGSLTGPGFGSKSSGQDSNGCFMAVFNVAAFRALDQFKKEVADFAHYLKSTQPSKGSSGVFYPRSDICASRSARQMASKSRRDLGETARSCA